MKNESGKYLKVLCKMEICTVAKLICFIPHPFSGAESSSGNHFRHGKELLRKRNTSHQKEENHDIKKRSADVLSGWTFCQEDVLSGLP